MKINHQSFMNSPFGKIHADADGSPIGMARINPEKSYSGISKLLEAYINHSDQAAWQKIVEKIDHTFESIDLALSALQEEIKFQTEVQSRLAQGQKLLFKPNIVNPVCINPRSHDSGQGSTACTEWGFIAALMRWFHDKMNIRYHQMAIGEAATAVPSVASLFSMMHPDGPSITPEAVIEGRSGDFYGGWGFYFARKYLAQSMVTNEDDDPMKGYAESVAGEYIPFGLASDKLMVYDLNRIMDNGSRGRNVAVSDGVNYSNITLHKAIIGGEQTDTEDRKVNPGCILINVPKLKVHAITLFTNAVKNLGIGLYPMQFSSSGGCNWDYSVPHRPVCGMKGGLPHEIWTPKIDPVTGLPQRDAGGKYVVEKTGGITATMIDVIKAVKEQDIFMLHVVDGIEAINIDHQGLGLGMKVPEGMVFASPDPVALDLLCARYMFCNVSLKESLKFKIGDGNGGYFPQKVPIPVLEGNNIISTEGFDCPIAREDLFEISEKRELGSRKYYGTGFDFVNQKRLFTLSGHLGVEKEGDFSDIITGTVYYDTFKFPWDMQNTTFNYLKASDKLSGTSIRKEFFEAFDEDGYEVLSYGNYGRKGLWGAILYLTSDMISRMGSERLGYLKGRYGLFANMLKNSDVLLNSDHHDIFKEYLYGGACSAAFQISQLDMEFPDPFQPDLTCGKGKWPSFQLAQFFHNGVLIYGPGYPYAVGFPSMYSLALLYADLTQNGGQYAGRIWEKPNVTAINKYVDKAGAGELKPLQFTMYMPAGYDNLSGKMVPNIEITDDPARILTTVFADGKEVWPDV